MPRDLRIVSGGDRDGLEARRADVDPGERQRPQGQYPVERLADRRKRLAQLGVPRQLLPDWSEKGCDGRHSVKYYGKAAKYARLDPSYLTGHPSTPRQSAVFTRHSHCAGSHGLEGSLEPRMDGTLDSDSRP